MNHARQKLTVLSYGGGQDSAALLLLYVSDPSFRSRYADGEFIVVMSDTGDEHPHTKDWVIQTKKLCAVHKIPFFHLTKDQGFHCESWPDLISPQLRDEGGEFKPTLVQLGTKTCTLKLKLDPIYKFLDEFVNDRFGYGFDVSAKSRGCGKRAIKRFGQENGRIRVLIGFAKGEEGRMEKSKRLEEKQHAAEEDSFWKHIEREFPLIDLSLDRVACQKLIADHGFTVLPSNCMRCPYMSPEELYWLHLNAPEKFDEWVRIEERKLGRYAGSEKNHGVFNSKETLTKKLEKVKAKYAHMSGEALGAMLNDWKMNHGCGSGGY